VRDATNAVMRSYHDEAKYLSGTPVPAMTYGALLGAELVELDVNGLEVVVSV
jgi:hypothetical protein